MTDDHDDRLLLQAVSDVVTVAGVAPRELARAEKTFAHRLRSAARDYFHALRRRSTTLIH